VYRLAGDLDRAVSAYEAVVSGPRGDDPAACDRHIWARNGLALVALDRGAADRALRLTEQTRHATPKDDPSHLDLCDRLDVHAMALLADGRAQDALGHLEQARAQIEASAGAEHRAMIPILVAEAESHHALNRLQNARDSLERALVIDTRDPTTPDVASRARALHEELRSEARWAD
jgi:tetratricopeptide (TPR) repeat protein